MQSSYQDLEIDLVCLQSVAVGLGSSHYSPADAAYVLHELLAPLQIITRGAA